MLFDQQFLGPAGDFIGVAARGVQDIDFHQAVLVEESHGPGRWDVDRIVQVKAQHLTFGCQDADHPVPFPADTDPLVQGVFVTKEFFFDRTAQHGVSPGRPGIVIGQKMA